MIHDGKEVHIVCKACGWVTHSDTYNNYYTHMRSPKEGVPSPCAQKLATTKEKEKSKAKEQKQTELTTEDARKYKDAFALFMRKTVPILCVQAGMSHGAATKFLVNYEEHRPIMGPLKAAKLVTRTHVTWNAHEKALAADLWKIIRDEVGKCRIFGVAIDAAVDRVLARFILIIVMYVGSLVFELPPVYEPNGEAFNGAKAGKAIFDSLMLNLGIINDTKVPLAAKCRYLMVDGCGVNHCARAELSALVKEHLNDHCTPVGTNDYQDLNNGGHRV